MSPKYQEYQFWSFQIAAWSKRNFNWKNHAILLFNSFLIHNSTTKPFPDMISHRIATRTILWKFISIRSLTKVSLKAKKAHMWCVLQFEIICLVIRHKYTCGRTLILVKVERWPAASINLTLHTKWCKLSQIQNKEHFWVVLSCFSKVSWKLEYFQISSFNRRWKHH